MTSGLYFKNVYKIIENYRKTMKKNTLVYQGVFRHNENTQSYILIYKLLAGTWLASMTIITVVISVIVVVVVDEFLGY